MLSHGVENYCWYFRIPIDSGLVGPSWSSRGLVNGAAIVSVWMEGGIPHVCINVSVEISHLQRWLHYGSQFQHLNWVDSRGCGAGDLDSSFRGPSFCLKRWQLLSIFVYIVWRFNWSGSIIHVAVAKPHSFWQQRVQLHNAGQQQDGGGCLERCKHETFCWITVLKHMDFYLVQLSLQKKDI